MTYGVDDSAADAGAPPAGSPAAPASPPPAGWYPDPWDPGQHRFWDGRAWTSDAFPNGPKTAWVPPSGPPPPLLVPTETFPETTPPRSGRAIVVLAVIAGLLLGFLAAVGVHYAFNDHTGATASAPVTAPATVPATNAPQQPAATVPTDPSQSVLSGLVIHQSDVAASLTVQPLPGGDQVSGQPTLDLCNGNFPSESLRSARLQVAAFDAAGTPTVSTEAVLYANPAATQQAFAELTTKAANCPSAPVTSPVGEPTVSTHFNAVPDSTWPQTATVDRKAYDFIATDQLSGQAQHFVGVYLRRGRVLVGVYFSHPDGPQAAISGQTTVAGIVGVIAARIAELPASVVNSG